MLNRNGTLVAHAYELMDRGPELDRDALVEMICDRARGLVGADAAVLWVSGEDGESRAEPVVAGTVSPSHTGIVVEKELVELITSDGRHVLNSSEAPLRPRLVRLCEELENEHSGALCAGWSDGTNGSEFSAFTGSERGPARRAG